MTFSIAPSIETQSSFFEWEIKLFPIKKIFINFLERLLTRYLRMLNSSLDEAYTDLQGALVVLREYTREEAQRDLPAVHKAIDLLATYKSHLEKAEYLGSKELESKINHVISAIYDVEIQLKKKAFAGQSRKATDPELIEAMTSASKKAIQSVLR